jgi:hypothetical protein
MSVCADCRCLGEQHAWCRAWRVSWRLASAAAHTPARPGMTDLSPRTPINDPAGDYHGWHRPLHQMRAQSPAGGTHGTHGTHGTRVEASARSRPGTSPGLVVPHDRVAQQRARPGAPAAIRAASTTLPHTPRIAPAPPISAPRGRCRRAAPSWNRFCDDFCAELNRARPCRLGKQGFGGAVRILSSMAHAGTPAFTAIPRNAYDLNACKMSHWRCAWGRSVCADAAKSTEGRTGAWRRNFASLAPRSP